LKYQLLLRLKDLADRDYNRNDVKGAAAYNDALQAKVARQRALKTTIPVSTQEKSSRMILENRRGGFGYCGPNALNSFSTANRFVALL
jgi:hypothetical protein